MNWNDSKDVLDFLCRIDDGYIPSHTELQKLAEITEVTLDPYTEINSLPKSIGLLKNLYALDLDNTSISNLDVLSEVTCLRNLYICNTPVADIAPLASLTNLNTFYANNTEINNFQVLAALEKLERLFLANTHFEDATVLSGLLELKAINLSGCPVSNISVLGNLISLQELRLYGTQINDISWLSNLKNLEILDISHTKVVDLSPLSGLHNLRDLRMRNTLVEDNLPLSYLSNLVALDISDSEYVDILNLENLKSLRLLTLTGVRMINAAHLSKLEKLEILVLTHAKDIDLNAIARIINLRKLHLGRTQISNVDVLSVLTNLEELYLWGTEITSIDKLSTLKRLKELDVSCTKIHNIPRWIGKLKELKTLVLQGLSLHSIPSSLIQLDLPFMFDEVHWDNGIFLYGTTVATQPITLFMQPREMIETYYNAKRVAINEAKVIFLGDGGVGKTHTIKRLLNNGKQDHYETETTPGINISNYWAEKDGHHFNIHFWDFGGQEIMHAMHRCFLTERTCYVVILSNRADGDLTSRARYWLKNIQSFAPNARVLLAVNRWDNIQSGGLDMNRLIQEYPNLCSTPVHYSAKNSNEEDFAMLTNAIIREASKLDSTAMYFPVQWANIRQELLEIAQKRHYIDKYEYHQICEKQGIDSAEIRTWLLEWFNDLGICFSYHQNKGGGDCPAELDSYKVLNPQWLTNAIYILINHGKNYAEHGKLHTNTIKNLLHNPTLGVLKGVTYSDQEIDYVLDVMRKFKLSYSVSATHEFIPALCEPNTPPQLHPDGYPYRLSYQMEYSYLPDSVVHQLMIRCYKDLHPEKIWRKGMRIDIDCVGLCAVVDMGDDDATLRIDVYSLGTVEPWKLLNNIRNYLALINSDLGLKAKDSIIIRDGSVGIAKSVKELLAAKEQGIKNLTIYNEVTEKIKDYPVDEILGITFGKETIFAIQKQAEENEQSISQVFANCQISVVNVYQQPPMQPYPDAMEIIRYLILQQSRINEKVINSLVEALEKTEDEEADKLVAEVKDKPKKGILQKLDEFLKCTVSVAENGKKVYTTGKGVVNAIMATWPVICEEMPEIAEFFCSLPR